MSSNQLCGVYIDYDAEDEELEGTYTAEGITELCEGLRGGAITSLECAAAP